MYNVDKQGETEMTYAKKSETQQKELIRNYLNREIEVIKRLDSVQSSWPEAEHMPSVISSCISIPMIHPS